MASYPRKPAPPALFRVDAGAFWMVATLLLGFTVAIAVVFALMMRADAHKYARRAAQPAPAHSHAVDPQRGAAAEQLRRRRAGERGRARRRAQALRRDAAAADAGDLVKVHMTLKDVTIEIAPGVKYNTWAFDGHGAPGPVVHVRQGQTVEMTLTNGGAIPHSIDFHAARIAPNKAFRDVAPGESFTFRFKAGDPGVFMYHCGTKPVLAHIANGMYGAIVVTPTKALPPVDHEYVLVASEWYLNGDGIKEPASLDMAKARAMNPDWTTFNGYANQYVTHPLTADPGRRPRFYVVAAGPTLDTNFHVVGTILDRAWVNGDMTSPPQVGVQTVVVPAGGGGVFDVKIDDEGLYPFVSHAFAHVDLGQVGLLKVGNPQGDDVPLMARLLKRRWRFAAVLGVAAILAAVLIGASQIGASDAKTTVPPQPVESLFSGIEQHGAALGSPDAPVTLVEYADLQCPYCAQWARETLPVLVHEYVETGKLRIVFNGLAFIGADSDKALRTAIAAGRDDHLWDLVHGLYASQGAENSGWVTDGLVGQIAPGVPGLDGGKLLSARWGSSVEPELRRAAAAAERAGVHGTPAFQVGRTGGRLELVEVSSLGPDGIRPAIEAVLAG